MKFIIHLLDSPITSEREKENLGQTMYTLPERTQWQENEQKLKYIPLANKI